jgi:hypothetical protein
MAYKSRASCNGCCRGLVIVRVDQIWTEVSLAPTGCEYRSANSGWNCQSTVNAESDTHVHARCDKVPPVVDRRYLQVHLHT